MPKKAQVLVGTLQQLLFSPKGGVEGFLLSAGGRTLQVSLPPQRWAALAPVLRLGRRVRLKAVVDDSPKATAAVHPVYRFEDLVDSAGKIVDPTTEPDGETQIKGVVAALHYAKHGEPNGVILETGEFIHLRPHGMEQTALTVGAKVTARGHVRNTILGTLLLEARQVNRFKLA